MSKQVSVSKKEKEKEKEKFVDWRKCEGRAILIEDLEPGGLLYNMNMVPADHLFKIYKRLPEFKGVPFQQFKARLQDHRRQADYANERARSDERALIYDRRLYPRQQHNNKGGLVFDLHPAKLLLRQDVKNGVHLRLKPSELQRTRPAYRDFKPAIFKHRIYQEARRQRFFNYLALKREEEQGRGPVVPCDELRRRHDLANHIQDYT